MLKSDYTQKLLGLKDAILENVEDFNDLKIIHIKMHQRIHPCPHCNTYTSKVHDYKIQRVKDISICGKNVILQIKKRRHVCPCCNKRFYESIPFLPKYQRTTTRLWANIIDTLSKDRSFKSISQEVNLSPTSVARIMDFISYPTPNLPDTISIDEFKGNAGGEKFQCILTNPRAKKVIDILPSRRQDSLFEYFLKFKDRNNVKYVVMDMSNLFRSTISTCFPNAKIVADKFHVVRLVTWAFEKVRKRVQKLFYADRRKYFKSSRLLLLKDPSKLTADELDQVTIMLSLSKDLASAYKLKNDFYKFMHSKNRAEATKNLASWYLTAGVAEIPEFLSCINTFNKWQHEILNAFETGLSNGFTEGCNNRIKVLKRISYGLRNFARFRNRILHCMNN